MLCGFLVLAVKIARKVKQNPGPDSGSMTIQPRSGSTGPDVKPPLSDEVEMKNIEGPSENVANVEGINPEKNLAELEELVNDMKIEKPKAVDEEDEEEEEEEEDISLIKEDDFDENGNPVFPLESLAKLDEMVNKPKWIIPVLPKAELEVLVNATIKLAKKGTFKYIICNSF